jgi:hypothetical protein
MRWKMAQYHRNKIKFISLYPDNLRNLDWVFRAKFREVVGVDLPGRPSFGPRDVKLCTSCGTPLASLANFCAKCGRPIPSTSKGIRRE